MLDLLAVLRDYRVQRYRHINGSLARPRYGALLAVIQRYLRAGYEIAIAPGAAFGGQSTTEMVAVPFRRQPEASMAYAIAQWWARPHEGLNHEDRMWRTRFRRRSFSTFDPHTGRRSGMIMITVHLIVRTVDDSGMLRDKEVAVPVAQRYPTGSLPSHMVWLGTQALATTMVDYARQGFLSVENGRILNVSPTATRITTAFNWTGNLQNIRQQIRTRRENVRHVEATIQRYQNSLAQENQNIEALRRQEAQVLAVDDNGEWESTLAQIRALPGVSSVEATRSRLVVTFLPSLCRDVRSGRAASRRLHLLIPPAIVTFAAGNYQPSLTVDEGLHPHRNCGGDFTVAFAHCYNQGDLLGAVIAASQWRRTHGAGSYNAQPEALVSPLFQYFAHRYAGPRLIDRDGGIVPFNPSLSPFPLVPRAFPDLSNIVIHGVGGSLTAYRSSQTWDPRYPPPPSVRDFGRIPLPVPNQVTTVVDWSQRRNDRRWSRLFQTGAILGWGAPLPANERILWNQVDILQSDYSGTMNRWATDYQIEDNEEHITAHDRRYVHSHQVNFRHTPEQAQLHSNHVLYGNRPGSAGGIPPRLALANDAYSHVLMHDEAVNHTHVDGLQHLPGEDYQHAVWDAPEGTTPPPPPVTETIDSSVPVPIIHTEEPVMEEQLAGTPGRTTFTTTIGRSVRGVATSLLMDALEQSIPSPPEYELVEDNIEEEPF